MAQGLVSEHLWLQPSWETNLNHQALTFGPFEIRPAARVLLEDGVPVALGSRALDILLLLAQRAGQVVGKHDLMAHVWPSTVVEEGTLRVHIAALRKCLREGREGARYIANIAGRGYSFVAPVAAVRRQSAPPEVAPSSGLPAPQARVIGRDDLIAALAAKLALRRFITVVGPGGVGKTSVALRTAEIVAANYPDGAAFIDLAHVTTAGLVASAMATALGLSTRQDDPTAELVGLLQRRRMLLVFDSCERVVDAAAQLCEAVFNAAPGVHILATSREPLRAHGEWVTRLGPLDVPPQAAGHAAADALTFPAVQLFVERATAMLDSFQLSDANAALVCQICRRLDGMPLALELAAARADALGLQGIAELLDDRLRLLATTGRRTQQGRHRSLQATLDWSVALLPDAEQAVLRRLAVFAGPFALKSAVAVVDAEAGGASAMSDRVANLVTKSLLVAQLEGAEPHYRLLDTTRAYAWDRLVQAGEAAQVSQRHATHYRDVFAVAAREAESRPAGEWLGLYAPHLDNLRAALDWAFAQPGQARLGVELTLAAVPLWNRLLLVRECQACIERAIAAPRDDRGVELDIALHAALGATLSQANLSSAHMRSALTHALDLAESTADRQHQLQALWGLWVTELNKGRFRAGLELARRFCSVAAASDDPNDTFVGDRLMAYTLHFLGDQDAARTHIERMLGRYVPTERQAQSFKYQFDQLVIGRMTLALILWLQGFPDQAMQSVEANVRDAQSIGHPLSLCNALVKSCCPIALLNGDLDAAQRFVGLLLEHTRPHALFMWHPIGRCYEGLVQMQRGDRADGLRAVRGALDELPTSRFALPQTWVLSEVALAEAGSGAIASGLATIDGAIERAEQDDERWCLAELLRVRGEILLLEAAAGAHAAAEEQFVRALELAQQQGVRSWQLRSATSLARLYDEQGRGADALRLLAPLYNRFAEGFGTADLRRARALLDKLGRAPAGADTPAT